MEFRKVLDNWKNFRLLASQYPNMDQAANDAASRMDEMAKDAGIVIHDGRFRYLLGEYEEDEITGQFVWFQAKRMPASEQQAIQEWLLIKEQLKNKK